MEPAGMGATWTGSPKGAFAERKHHKPGLALNNNTARVRGRQDMNRARVAGHRDDVEGVVANTLNGAVKSEAAVAALSDRTVAQR
jgi:hypothetical protein